jgi:hypothetical protein
MTEINNRPESPSSRSELVTRGNERLQSMLIQLKDPDSLQEEQGNLLGEANDVLQSAIFQFPDLVHSIQVWLSEASYGNLDSVDSRFSESGRWSYTRLVDISEEQGIEGVNPLVIPLPFGFTTGTHGSGERAAISASRQEIYFGLAISRGAHGNQRESREPVLFATLRKPLITSSEAIFLLSEVEEITLSARDDFTPYIVDNERVDSRGDSINNYLFFRGFVNRGIGQHIEVFPKPIVLTCNEDTGLWDFDWETRRLKTGFFMTYDSAEGWQMYEVHNKQMGNPYDEKDIGSLVEIALGSNTQSKKRHSFNPLNLIRRSRRESNDTLVYAGNEIIKRLSEIPVAQRHF